MKLFITGATGTLGQEVLKQIPPGYIVYGLTRSEKKFFELKRDCIPVLGDIRDRERMVEVTRGMDMIFHFAAFKHVDLMEGHYEESIKTNLEGTRNLVYAQKVNDISKIVFTSTDKAMYPINIYGQCKALAEKAVLQNDNNIVCRYGNVFGSNGSIFQRLPGMLEDMGVIPLTHKDMTRFWIKPKDAARFVLSKGLYDLQGGVKIPEMKAAKMIDMFNIAAKILGYEDVEYSEIGLRAGEKIHEDLSPTLNSRTAPQFTEEELKELIKNEITPTRS